MTFGVLDFGKKTSFKKTTAVSKVHSYDISGTFQIFSIWGEIKVAELYLRLSLKR